MICWWLLRTGVGLTLLYMVNTLQDDLTPSVVVSQGLIELTTIPLETSYDGHETMQNHSGGGLSTGNTGRSGVLAQGVTTMVGSPAAGNNPYNQQMGLLIPPGQQAPPPYPGQVQGNQPVIQQPSTPIFVAPPPRTQRLLHSEAYLKYIEGLTAESNCISKWDQTLSARRRDVHLSKEQESRLPSHWLKSKGAHTTMANALWRLRDLMLRDTLNIRQAYNIENV